MMRLVVGFGSVVAVLLIDRIRHGVMQNRYGTDRWGRTRIDGVIMIGICVRKMRQ